MSRLHIARLDFRAQNQNKLGVLHKAHSVLLRTKRHFVDKDQKKTQKKKTGKQNTILI
jgi:hypothetical protein